MTRPVAAPLGDVAEQRHDPSVRDAQRATRGRPVREGVAHLHEVGHDLDLALGQPGRRDAGARPRSGPRGWLRHGPADGGPGPPETGGAPIGPAARRRRASSRPSAAAATGAPPRGAGCRPGGAPSRRAFHWRWTTSAERSRTAAARSSDQRGVTATDVALDDLEVGPSWRPPRPGWCRSVAGRCARRPTCRNPTRSGRSAFMSGRRRRDSRARAAARRGGGAAASAGRDRASVRRHPPASGRWSSSRPPPCGAVP